MDTEPIRKGVDAVRAYLLEVGDCVSIMGRTATVVGIKDGQFLIRHDASKRKDADNLLKIGQHSREWVRVVKKYQL